MLQTVPLQSTGKLPFVLRRRFEFAGALVVAAFLPWAGSRWLITDTTFSPSVFHTTLIANVLRVDTSTTAWSRTPVSTS